MKHDINIQSAFQKIVEMKFIMAVTNNIIYEYLERKKLRKMESSEQNSGSYRIEQNGMNNRKNTFL